VARRKRILLDLLAIVVGGEKRLRPHAESVVLSSVDGGGHSWPGGKALPQWMVGPTSSTVDATAEMWAFFREHPVPTESRLETPPQPCRQSPMDAL